MKTKYNSFTVYENENGEKLYVEYFHSSMAEVYRNLNKKRDKETMQLRARTSTAFQRFGASHNLAESVEWANWSLEDRLDELGYREVGLV